MKHTVLFLLLLLPLLATAQQITKDTAYLIKTVTGGVTYYQTYSEVRYDDGTIDPYTGPRIDSVEFVRRAFRDAHDAMLPVAEAARVHALRKNQVQRFNYLSKLLKDVTGKTYFQGVEDGTYAQYNKELSGVWRVFYTDTVGAEQSFYFYYAFNDSTKAGTGREISNQQQVLANNAAPNYVNAGRRIVFSAYEKFFTRMNIRRRINGTYRDLWANKDEPELREIDRVADDDGVDRGRTVWLTADNSTNAKAPRLVRLRDDSGGR